MGVYTEYDMVRDRLRESISDCLVEAKELLDEDIWGYNEMVNDYGLNIYAALKKVRDMI